MGLCGSLASDTPPLPQDDSPCPTSKPGLQVIRTHNQETSMEALACPAGVTPDGAHTNQRAKSVPQGIFCTALLKREKESAPYTQVWQQERTHA